MRRDRERWPSANARRTSAHRRRSRDRVRGANISNCAENETPPAPSGSYLSGGSGKEWAAGVTGLRAGGGHWGALSGVMVSGSASRVTSVLAARAPEVLAARAPEESAVASAQAN